MYLKKELNSLKIFNIKHIYFSRKFKFVLLLKHAKS